MTEQELIKKIRSGDRKAFNTLCLNRYPILISYAQLFVKGEASEDIVQDVLFSVWRNRIFLQEDGSLKGYLLRSIYNRCMNYLNSEKKASAFRTYNGENLLEKCNSYISPDSNPVLAKLFDEDLSRILDKAIKGLSPKCQEVFRLSYIEEMTNREISKRLGISVSTVKNHMHLALAQLRLSLSDDLSR